MKIALYLISHRLGMHPTELAKAIRNGDITGDVPGGNAQSKDAWVDLMSLRNYLEWIREKGEVDEIRYQKSLRHIDNEIAKAKARQ